MVDFITGDLYIDEIDFKTRCSHYMCPFYVSNKCGSIICRVTWATCKISKTVTMFFSVYLIILHTLFYRVKIDVWDVTTTYYADSIQICRFGRQIFLILIIAIKKLHASSLNVNNWRTIHVLMIQERLQGLSLLCTESDLARTVIRLLRERIEKRSPIYQFHHLLNYAQFYLLKKILIYMHANIITRNDMH